MSVAPLAAYKDKFLVLSDPDGACLITDIDSGETLHIDWETATRLLAKMEEVIQ